jgi:rhodanese-related sulfurtransferase
MNSIKVDTMSWIIGFAIVVVAGSVLLHGQSSQISPEDAQAYLKNGALVIDVRAPEEFSAGHLPNAMNIPLQQIESGVSLPLKYKKQVLLLHCKSGMRSAKATRLLIGLGYTNVFNLGSYSRAEQIVAAK